MAGNKRAKGATPGKTVDACHQCRNRRGTAKPAAAAVPWLAQIHPLQRQRISNHLPCPLSPAPLPPSPSGLLASLFATCGLAAVLDGQVQPAVRLMAFHDFLRSMDCVLQQLIVACGTESAVQAATELFGNNTYLLFGTSVAAQLVLTCVTWHVMDCRNRYGSWAGLLRAVVRPRRTVKGVGDTPLRRGSWQETADWSSQGYSSRDGVLYT